MIQSRVPTRAPRGFTLLEVLVCVGVIAIVAVSVVPMLGDETGIRVSAAAAILESDIEYLQTLNMSDPSKPMLIRFDEDEQAWWIAPVADPDRPLRRPNGSYYVTVPGLERATSAAGVTFETRNLQNGTDLIFTASGSLSDPSTIPAIELTAGDRTIRLRISPHTGRVIMDR